MIGWMILPLKRYAEFSGRSRRMEYWSFALFNIIIGFILTAGLFVTGAASGLFANMQSADPTIFLAFLFGGVGVVFGIWILVFIIPNTALHVRRLHDRNMSGWWFLGYIVIHLIPILNLFTPIAWIALLIIALLPGTPGPNQYGPDPKDPTGAEIFA